jgi:hypothetical protein
MATTLTFKLASAIAASVQGRMQVNPPTPAPYDSIMLLDQVKQAFYYWQPRTSNAGTVVLNDDYTKLSSLGWPQSMPTAPATGWYLAQVYVHGQAGDQWDLYYPTDATVQLDSRAGGLTLSEATIGSGHKRYTITAATYNNNEPQLICSLWISAMGSAMGANSIQLCCYKRNGVVIDNKARLDAGEIFDPLFLDDLTSGGKAWGKIRFMDLMATNGSLLKLYSNWTPNNFATGLGRCVNASYWAGDATKGALNTYTFPRFVGAPGSWTDGLMWAGRLRNTPTSWAATATKGATTTFVTPVAHGLSNGDLVEACYNPASIVAPSFDGNEWNALFAKANGTGLPPQYAVTVVNSTTFTIAYNSSGLSTSSVLIGLAPAMYFKDTVLGTKRAIWSNFNPSYLDREQFAIDAETTWQYDSEFDVVYAMNPTPWPVQRMCALANLIDSDPQFTLPFGMVDASCAAFAADVNTYLEAGRTPDFSCSNEVWNSGFTQYHNAYSVSKKYYSAASVPDGYGKRLVAMADAIATQLGARAHRFTLDIQHNIATNRDQTNFDAWMKATNVSGGIVANYPASKVHIVTTAPYVLTKIAYDADAANYTNYQTNINLWKSGVPASMDTAYAWAADEFWNGPSEPGTSNNLQMASAITDVAWLVTAAAAYTGRDGAALRYQQYEGGSHQYGTILDDGFPTGGITVAEVYNFWQAVQRSTQYAAKLKLLHEGMFNAGARFTSHFNISWPWKDGNGYWGLQEGTTWDAARTPQWTYLKEFNDYTFAPVFSAGVTVTLSGGNIVGGVATAVSGSYYAWPDVTASPTYQWYRNGVAINGAIGASYTFVLADDLQTITVKETVYNSIGSTTSTSGGVQVGVFYGAGTAEGDLLGSEPDGFAYLVSSGKILVRDSTGIKNYYGNLSAMSGAGNYVLTSDLPFSQSAGSIWAVASHSGSGTDRLFEMVNNSSFTSAQIDYNRNGDNKITLVTRSNGGLQINTQGTATSSTKHAMRWAENDVKTYVNGVADITGGTFTVPSSNYERIYIFNNRSVSSPWLGSKTSICWVPRAMDNTELAAKST